MPLHARYSTTVTTRRTKTPQTIPGVRSGREVMPAMWSSSTRTHSHGQSIRTADRSPNRMRALPVHVSDCLRGLRPERSGKLTPWEGSWP
jgi:hypothetical protein